MKNENKVAENSLREESVEYERWYTIEEARAISGRNIKEHYARLNRQTSN